MGSPVHYSLKRKTSEAYVDGQTPHSPRQSRPRQDELRRSTGSVTEPGRVVSKNERREKRDSLSDLNDEMMDGPKAPDDTTFTHLGAKIRPITLFYFPPWVDFMTQFKPHDQYYAMDGTRYGPFTLTARSVVVSTIFFVVVFSSLINVVDYLLLATRASAACSTATIFIPVTSVSTTTVYAPCSPSTTFQTTTITSTSTLHNTVTVVAEISGSSTLGPYYYGMNSGTTSWVDGRSPSSGAVLATETTSIFVSPVATMPSATTVTVESTITDYETVTPPAYTSTLYSFAAPAITITSTSTYYKTISLSLVSPASTSQSPSSFSGVGTEGWNSTAVSPESAGTSSESQPAETITQSYYSGIGSLSTSTRTTHITTTLHVTDTTTETVSSTGTTSFSSGSGAGPVMGSTSSLSFAFMTSDEPSYITGLTGSGVSTGLPLSSPGSAGFYPNSTLVDATPASGSSLPTHSFRGTSYRYTPSSFHPSISLTLASNSSTADAVSTSLNGSTTSRSIYLTAPPSSTSEITSVPQHLSNGTNSGTHSSHSGTSSPTISAPATTTSPSKASASDNTTSTATLRTHTLSTSIRSVASNSTSINSFSSLISAIGATSTGHPTLSASISGHSAPSSPVSTHPSSATASSTSSHTSLHTTSSTPTFSISSLSKSASPTLASAAPTACGEYGNFTLTFDDLPNFNPTNQNRTDITEQPPVPNPYNHLTFSDGYVYAPSKREPYAPHSAPNVAVFLANGAGMSASTATPGEIADGPYESSSAFWFDAHSAWLGCDNVGPENCEVLLTGYTYSVGAEDEIPTYSHNVTIPPCSASSGCPLHEIQFPTEFCSLTGVQMQAYVGGDERMFFVDDIALSWSNNTCAAGLLRLQYQ